MQHSQNLFNRYKAIGEKGKAQEFISYSSCLCMCLYLIFTVYINIHISSYFKTSPTKYQYTFSLHTGLQIPLLKVRFVLDKGCSDFIFKKNHSFSFLINWQILIKLLSASTLNKSKQIMRKVKKLWLGERNQID